MAGVDAADAATKAGEGRSVADYTQALKADALKGARLGIARDFLGQDTDVDWVMEASLETMRKQGATIVDVRLPNGCSTPRASSTTRFVTPSSSCRSRTTWDARSEVSEEHHRADRARAARQRAVTRRRQPESRPVVADGPRSGQRHADGLPIHLGARSRFAVVRAVLDGILAANKLDAIVYPTASRRPQLIAAPPECRAAPPAAA